MKDCGSSSSAAGRRGADYFSQTATKSATSRDEQPAKKAA